MDYLNSVGLPVPFAGCYWVLPQLLLAGSHPGRGDDLRTRGRLEALVGAGIRFFIDLTGPQELPDYRALLNRAAHEMGVELTYLWHPIVDFSIPSVEKMREILDEIDRQHALGRSVYLHCRGGIGRTGTVVGCYLVRHGLSGEQALGQIATLRKQSAAGVQSSPETLEQVSMVLKWQQ